MAAKKKARKKKKAPKKAKKRPAVRKKVAKKARRAVGKGPKKAKKSTKKPAKKKAKKKVAAKPKARAGIKLKMRLVKPAAPPAPPVPANEERIGIVTHYFNHLGVAIIQLETGVLREGDTVHIKGHTSDFRQRVGSMEVEHAHVSEARPGQSFGLKVSEHAREHDVVYRVKGM